MDDDQQIPPVSKLYHQSYPGSRQFGLHKSWDFISPACAVKNTVSHQHIEASFTMTAQQTRLFQCDLQLIFSRHSINKRLGVGISLKVTSWWP